MGKDSGFLDWDRMLPSRRDRRERLGDWRELQLAQTPEVTRQQAGRCMDCGVPFCHQGCPLGNLIPDWNDLVYRGRWEQAWRRLDSTNDFPEFTGRLCPAPCEAACVLAINADAVTIEQLEKEITERAFSEGWVKPRPPLARTGRTVAIVGSGPAGLAAASQLNRVGHSVTVFERDDRVGGLLRYGIPDFKLEKAVLDRRLALLEAEGVRFVTSAPVGDSPTWPGLVAEHDAVVVAIGARRARDLKVPGRELPGVHFAMDYLERSNRAVAGDELPADTGLDAAGKRVIILGGGDTGSDCLGTALRQGAASVTQIELLPAPPEGRDARNPWPEWPLVFRTSSSQEEGGARDFAFLTRRLEGRDGVLSRLHGVRCEVDRSGGGFRIVEIPDSEEVMDVDLLILAMGFTGPDTEVLSQQLGLALDSRGNVAVDGDLKTSHAKVWGAGDAVRGASLIVWAISQGREAARAVDAALSGSEPRVPTRGVDCSW